MIAGSAAGLVGAIIALVQLRHGIVPLLDTVTYWSGAESIASGHLFHTTLAPSFSNFDAVEFLQRNGRLPFVDFPIAYPLIAGTVGAVIGARAAMHALTVLAIATISIAIVRGAMNSHTQHSGAAVGSPRLSKAGLVFVTVAAGSIPLLPAMRLVTQGALSEPLFIASTLLLVVSLSRFRAGGPWSPVVALVIVSSLLRFLGTPLALLAGWEHWRRTGRLARSSAWTAVMMLPAGTNIVAASAAGGGHNAGWRGLDRLDVEVFVRSVGGWFDGIQGDIRRTYFTTDGPSWWSWPVTVVVLITMTSGVIGVIRRKPIFTDTADIALTAAAILTVGLFAGILGFDALVIADNRLMLPIGVLVASAIVWTAFERMPSRALVTSGSMCALVIWGVVATRPWNLLERFSDIERPIAMSNVTRDLGIDVVISDDADAVHWDTGIPAAYTPMPIKPLTGEVVDDVEIYRLLPCPLYEANGAIVISNETTFSTVNRRALDELTERGLLRRVTEDRATVFLATSRACD